MNLFGKPLADYIRFVLPLAMAIAIVGIARLVASVASVPNETTRWISMSVVMWIGVIYYSIRVHKSGFGGYKQLLPVVFIPNFVQQSVAIVGILIGIFTGQPNVYTAPEFAFGSPGDTWGHLGAHVAVGIPVATLVNWIVGCAVMAIARKIG